jgi:hypothetical protein
MQIIEVNVTGFQFTLRVPDLATGSSGPIRATPDGDRHHSATRMLPDCQATKWKVEPCR